MKWEFTSIVDLLTSWKQDICSLVVDNLIGLRQIHVLIHSLSSFNMVLELGE